MQHRNDLANRRTRHLGGRLTIAAAATAAALGALVQFAAFGSPPQADRPAIKLPAADRAGGPTLAAALAARRSVRSFSSKPLSLAQVAQLLWAAQGVSGPLGRRTVPSAGGFYPIEVYLAAGSVAHLPAGLYRYRPAQHDLLPVHVHDGSILRELAAAAHGQPAVASCPAAVVLTGAIDRTAKKYGHPLGDLFVHIEIGHAAQNLYLQAAALELGTVEVGGIDPGATLRALGSPAGETAFAILPVGAPAE